MKPDRTKTAALVHKNKDWGKVNSSLVGKVKMPVIDFFKGPFQSRDKREEFTLFDVSMEPAVHFSSSIRFKACGKFVVQPSCQIR